MAIGTDLWRGRACLLDKSSMERAPSGEIENMLLPRLRIGYRRRERSWTGYRRRERSWTMVVGEGKKKINI
jgi:hypothetical protein